MGRARGSGGSLEQEVVAALAAGGRPMTAADVRAELDRDLAYTTVLTALSRLYEKGALTREPHGRGHAYQLSADTATLTARRMQRLLAADDDRALVLRRFVDELSSDDERMLGTLLAHRPRRPSKQ